MSSNFVAVSFAIFIIGALLYLFLRDEKFLTLAVFGFMMMLPFSVMFSVSKPKNAFLIYAIAMGIVGISAIGITFSTGELFNIMTGIFLLGFIAFQWIANFILIREDNR